MNGKRLDVSEVNSRVCQLMAYGNMKDEEETRTCVVGQSGDGATTFTGSLALTKCSAAYYTYICLLLKSSQNPCGLARTCPILLVKKQAWKRDKTCLKVGASVQGPLRPLGAEDHQGGMCSCTGSAPQGWGAFQST